MAGRDRLHALADQRARVDQHARRDALFQSVAFEISRALGNGYQLGRGFRADAGFVADDFDFDVAFRITEVKRAETLFGRLLQVLENALVTRVVGNHQLEIRMGMDELVFLFQRQHAARVGQRMDHDRRVLARLDDFVEIADRPKAHGQCERPVLPARSVRIEQVTPDQVGCGHIFVAGQRDQRLAELPGHVFDEAGLAAAGRPLEHHRHAHGVGRFEQRHFIGDGAVIRFRVDRVLADDAVRGRQIIGILGIHGFISFAASRPHRSVFDE